jgi:hypothetical protein
MKLNPSQDILSRKLKDEATSDSTQFSPLLHARIMQQIKARPDSRLVQPSASWRIHWAVPAFAAAALMLIAATVWLHTPRTLQTPQVSVLPPNPSIPQLTLQFSSLEEMTGKPLTDANFGYLDRDAKNVLHYVINQFDVIPPPPGRRG